MVGIGIERTEPASVAWRNAIGMFVVLWLVGLLGFGWLAQLLATSLRDDLVLASFWLSLGFAALIAIVVIGVVAWQRAHGEALIDLGWRRPTPRTAVVLGVVYGVAWAALSYARGGSPAAWTWERAPMALIGVFLAFGEELAVRGFVLEHLRRGGVPTWIQVIVSAIGMGSYHGVLGWHYSVLYAVSSAVLFGLISILFVLGKRSLTPGFVAHALSHVLGDPTLTEGILQGILALP
jgi:membrane protease YdiL (CAAX protease family)